ncbi:hypothetical protein [Streptomyces turgidiscabies]|uniref:hypothetical protein n=1 Tax=Streptomyces turgidiscabies TaxID=85558 RepID=UPI0038F737C8
MSDPSTTRLALYKSKSDGSELVNYSQDLGQNWDKVDAAAGFQIVTSSTRPSSPYSGKPIAESDTGRLYYSNGSSPASGSWIEIASNGASFTTTGTRSITLNGTANSTTKFIALVSGDTFNRYELTADGTMNWGPGSGAVDVTLARTAASTLGTANGDHFKVGGDLKLVNGTTIHRNALAVGAGTTVANTTTETVVGTMTIAAGDAVAGAIYRVRMVANVSFLASAQLTWRVRLGGVAGTLLATAGPTTLSGTGQTNKESAVESDLICATTGASGTWFCMLQEVRNTQDTGSVGGASGSVGGGVQLGSTDGTVVRDTTAANDYVVTAQWAAASASNTLTGRCIFERIA